MNMEIRHLMTFKTIAEIHSFSKTAKLLGYTQSTVSMQIRALEEDLGTKMVLYQGRQVKITDIGQQLLPIIEKTLTDFATLKNWPQQHQNYGTLRIAAPESLSVSMIMPYIKMFNQHNPLVSIQLQNATCLHNEELLVNKKVDVAFMMWPSQPSQDLKDFDLGLQDMVLVQSTKAQKYDDLLNDKTATFIINEPECSYRNQFETTMWQQHQRKFKTMSLPSIAAIVTAVENGLGFSYLPRKMVQASLDSGTLVETPTDIENHIHAHLLVRKEALKTEMMTNFITCFRPLIG